MTSIPQRVINVTFEIGIGPLGDQPPKEKYSYQGLRVSANIVEAGGFAGNPIGQFTIFGMPPSEMNKVSMLGINQFQYRGNYITVEAGDTVNGTAMVFRGLISDAYIDFEAAPDAALQVTANDGMMEQIKAIPVTSYNGPVSAETIMAALAKQIGYAFENNGVNVVLSSAYFNGPALAQIQACAQHANINYQLRQNVLAIWPKSKARGFPIPTISPQTGMIGYPAYVSYGIGLRTIYNPAIIMGNPIKVQSSLQAACGTWNVFQLAHTLESQTPHGLWESQLIATRAQEAGQ